MSGSAKTENQLKFIFCELEYLLSRRSTSAEVDWRALSSSIPSSAPMAVSSTRSTLYVTGELEGDVELKRAQDAMTCQQRFLRTLFDLIKNSR